MSEITIADRCRDLAVFLDKYPNLPTPNTAEATPHSAEVLWYLFSNNDFTEQKKIASDIIRLLPGPANKVYGTDLFTFAGECDGVKWQVIVSRPAVCERVVTAVESVTTMITDPDAPKIEVTEDVETVEWVCSPLLSGAVA